MTAFPAFLNRNSYKLFEANGHTKHVVPVYLSNKKHFCVYSFFKAFYLIYSTFSWLNLSKSLSQLKEDSRRRCSNLKSDPQRSDIDCWVELIAPWEKVSPQSALMVLEQTPRCSQLHLSSTWADGSSVASFVLLMYFCLSLILIL